jgi:folate-dependent phosphoribosylglycinamide formyltransferase PurN
MRIVVCTRSDLAGTIALNTLRPVLQCHEVMIVVCNDGRRPYPQEFQYFMTELPTKHLFPLIEKQNNLTEKGFLTVSQIGRKYNVEVSTIERAMWGRAAEDIGEFAPDLLLSVRFPIIFKDPILSLPRLGAYNVHPGTLPTYGGVLVPLHAMLNGDDAIGCTLHRIDSGIDSGPIVGIKYLQINRNRSLIWHFCQIYPLGVSMICELVSRLEEGKSVSLQEQDSKKRRYYGFPTNEQVEQFLRMGCEFAKFDDYLSLLNLFLNDASILGEASSARPATCLGL